MGFEMGCKWPYSSFFVRCHIQDLFKIACSILLMFPCSFFPKCFVCAHEVHPYTCIDTNTAWNKCRLIISDRLDFHITYNLLMAVNSFVRRRLISFFSRWDMAAEVPEFINFSGLLHWMLMTLSRLNTLTVLFAFSQGSCCLL